MDIIDYSLQFWRLQNQMMLERIYSKGTKQPLKVLTDKERILRGKLMTKRT